MWYYKEETGNFAAGSIPMKEITVDEVVTYEEETGWVLIADRPVPHDDYVFDGTNWVAKVTNISVPQTLSPRQARLALLQAGLYDAVNSAVKLNPAHEIYWEYALEIQRNDALLIELSASLGMTSKQLDDLFVLGSTL